MGVLGYLLHYVLILLDETPCCSCTGLQFDAAVTGMCMVSVLCCVPKVV
jgi:hypothetical protein